MGGTVRVTVIGWDGRALTDQAAGALATATLVVGGRRHLDALGRHLPAGVRTVVLGGVAAGLAELTGHFAAGGGPAVVLASGDPGFFGILRTLRRHGLDRDHGVDVELLPATSSVAVAFARAGLPWDDALVVSAHGRSLRRAVHVCRAHHTVAVLTGPGPAGGPSALGAALVGLPRRMFVAEELGMPAERTGWCTPQQAAARRDWREPNIVIVRDTDHPRPGEQDSDRAGWLFPHRTSPPGWALDEAAFTHRDSMISKAEVRAVALARLGPGPGDLVWDVGAGSGSVAVECARLGAAVVAVDHDPDACARTRANARTHRVSVQVVPGSAPGVLTGLPAPDAVFVGGGGPEVVAACARHARRSVAVALAALDRVRPTWEALAAAGFDVSGTQLAASRLRPLPDGALRLAATNPIVLVWGERTGEHDDGRS
ncbi:precorrin-6y C5,15-methyltransferase subunit CbiE [Candidatus Protofrankia californiensis]|uniref:Precorrin-6y C5,15-methyltransferase subunit CbiE n=1 Tax=Candidatus Protofrankia californiensis TaxID=1839754 RepID=A0A1C3P098_9ACTN|nr:precorrin-6y C5,15-methyltransferase subunit CbiE [Candidatus Protofrankia californiensis]